MSFRRSYSPVLVHVLFLVGVTLATIGRLPVEGDLIGFDSPKGKQMLKDCFDQRAFWQLMQHWERQVQPPYCGVSSACGVLNALELPCQESVWFPNQSAFQYFTQDNLVEYPVMKRVVNKPDFDKKGMMLKEVAEVLADAGGKQIKVTKRHADNKRFRGSLKGVAVFRDAVKKSVQKDSVFVIVNYDREKIGQTPSAHFSPIGAYHEASDSVLILDVTKHKYPPVWVAVSKLYDAMNTLDKDADQNRGWIVVERVAKSE